MSRDHALIVDEMLAEYRARPDTVSVALFGSMARGTVSATSDIDMEVVSRDAPTWTLTKLQKGRIDVDLVICPYEQFSLQVSKYPFLRYDYLSYKVLYDPTQALRDAIAQLKEYYEAHPEIVAYW
ncbi:MAG: nucleotidyltransferase domain-containing protein [Chloroflexota bacterium]